MRLLLDECVPRRLGRLLEPHEVQTVPRAGWSGFKNGELLARAAESFDVFVTVDQGIKYQQNLVNHDICVVALAARSNDIRDLEPLVPKLLAALDEAQPRQVLRVAA
jgi:predicted nuclease of predicted toxin-antitoxin system